MKGILTSFGILIGMILLLSLLLQKSCKDLSSDLGKEELKYEKHLGEKQAIDNDTLTVVDYSIWNGTFILSNGQEVSYKIVAKDSTNDKE